MDLTDTLIQTIFGRNFLNSFNRTLEKNIALHNVLMKLIFDRQQICGVTCVQHLLNKLNSSLQTQTVVDNHFDSFVDFCREYDIELIVLSGGFKFVIESFLRKINSRKIFANNLSVKNAKIIFEGTVKLDKCKTMRQILQNLKLTEQDALYIGDGFSDLEIASYTDVKLFCKQNYKLHNFCKDINRDHYVFDSFEDIVHKLRFEINSPIVTS